LNYINKIQLPENISSIKDVDEYYDQNVNDLITYLFKKTKFNKHDILKYYRAYFKNIINKKIQDDYINLIDEFSNSILPIILKSKYPRQGTYQLLRFIDFIQPNFEFIEMLVKNSFSHKKISDILTFSGHATNLLSKDVKLLEIIDPYYEIKLNKNINIYQKEFNKIGVDDKEETILDKLRKIHRRLKFQIIVSIITDELKVEDAAHELYLLAYSTLKKVQKVAVDLISKEKNFNTSFIDDFGILAYGRFAQNLMTSNSDLDLVFIFPDKNQNFKNQKTYHFILSLIAQKMITILSSKTSENLIYEIDTKLGPKVRISSNACTLSEFKSFHENETFSWEKMALMKSKLVFKDNNFQIELDKFIKKLKSQSINSNKLIQEINQMRRIDIKPEKIKNDKEHINLNISENVEKKIHWYETKYSLGGQRDIEFLEFFYDDPKYHKTIENIAEKKHFIRKAKMFYFIIDQYVNLTYSNQKPSKLTNQILEKLQRSLNIRDLGSLKMSLKNTKNEINKFLLYFLENNK
jgi:glutamine synthetase adenylyltransferase